MPKLLNHKITGKDQIITITTPLSLSRSDIKIFFVTMQGIIRFICKIIKLNSKDEQVSVLHTRLLSKWVASLGFEPRTVCIASKHINFQLQLLLLSHFSRVRLCATPQTAAHQAPPSLGFSRREHWSGLPFPSPMHESEKWKGSRSACPSLNNLVDCSPPGSTVHGIFDSSDFQIFLSKISIIKINFENAPWMFINVSITYKHAWFTVHVHK